LGLAVGRSGSVKLLGLSFWAQRRIWCLPGRLVFEWVAGGIYRPGKAVQPSEIVEVPRSRDSLGSHVRIINRYVLKEHIGPFVFALSALTSLLLLQYIARKFGDLVGRGLSWQVITEFMLLSIPFTVAMTLPMAVLVAVLHAFSRMASENEITALKAGGISTRSLMRPALVGSVFLAMFMLWFNDQILPRTNHELATLQIAILRTKPSFALKEQVINGIKEGQLYLRAGYIDREQSGRLRDVTIYDVSDASRRRTIFGDRRGCSRPGRVRASVSVARSRWRRRCSSRNTPTRRSRQKTRRLSPPTFIGSSRDAASPASFSLPITRSRVRWRTKSSCSNRRQEFSSPHPRGVVGFRNGEEPGRGAGSDRSPRPPVGPGDGQWLTFDKPNVPGAGAFGRFLRRELDALPFA